MQEPDEELNRLSGDIVTAAIAVHRALGPGFLESVYEAAMAIELEMSGLKFGRQIPLSVLYRGRLVGDHRLDLLVESKIVVELKAVEHLIPVHRAQILSYLKASGHRLGLLINFNVPVLKDGIERVILSKS